MFKNTLRRISRYGVISLAALMLVLSVFPIITAANERDPILAVDFEDGTMGGFDTRGEDAGVLSLSKDVARSGDSSLLITQRQRNWNGIALDLLPHISANVTYQFTFWVHSKNPETSEFTLSTQIGEGGSASYPNLVKRNFNADDGWVEMTAEYTYSQVNLDTGHVSVYIENNKVETDFYIDDFSLTIVGELAPWDPLTEPITATSPDRRGEFMGFDYEFWSERGDGTALMQLTGPGTFWCQWADAHNVLFRTGKRLGSVMAHEEYGDITIDYTAYFHIESGSVAYLTAYGWTQDPLMEWYVVEQHGSYRPGGELVDTVEIDGGLYEIRIATRVEQPSIEGTKTFLQIFSIRKEHRTEGTITLSDHFKAWKDLGLDVSGNLYEVSMCIEGFQSSGSGSLSRHILTIGDEVYGEEPEPIPMPTPDGTPPEDTPDPTQTPDASPPPDDKSTSGGGFPEWGMYLIIGGTTLAAVVIVVIMKKKK
ncbi:MAG: glycoside hydrolase family 11 protein [Oscillospiraceae bacterium]|nr:glycoside hydrolase family 11 protein [Oscillospiraceae bacterium]